MILAQCERHVSFAALLAATALGCGNGKLATPAGGAQAPRVFVGQVAGTDVRVAVVASARHARVYFCGGASTYVSSTHWLAADIDSSQHVTLPSPQDWRLEAQLTDGKIRGTVDRGDGAPVPFDAAAVGQGTIAGLYEAAAPCGKVGLIVAQVSASAEAIGQGACIGQTPAEVKQVNPIMPVRRDPDGTISVTTSGTPDTTLVRPAAPPAD